MDFTKFLAMLEHGALFFPRSHLLGDPFEGSYSRANEALRESMYKAVKPDSRRQMTQAISRTSEQLRNWTMISCWHMNPAESAAMWKLYAETERSLAIQSTYKRRLRDSLDDQVYIGMVNYIDYETQWLPEGNVFYPFMHKRLSFEHEHELRAVIQDLSFGDTRLDLAKPPDDPGIWKELSLQKLAETVYVSPGSPGWFIELIRLVLERYKVAIEVRQSSLDTEPFY
ncbi:MAG: hypothetical protein IIB22_11995 [Chloroflexi bacterium]|nr:hypothetical protein [Chloroflexota bacterium]